MSLCAIVSCHVMSCKHHMRISRPVSGQFGVVCMGKVDALVAETWENWDWICPNVFMVG